MAGDCNPGFGIRQFPVAGLDSSHSQRMHDDEQSQASELRMLIAKNVSTLLPRAFPKLQGGKGIKEISQKSKIPNGSVGRIVTPGSPTYNVDYLGPLASALGVQPWQLLLPDLTVTTSGGALSIEGMRARQWPFPTLRREEIEGLTPKELDRLEATMRNRIAELKEDRSSSEGDVGNRASG